MVYASLRRWLADDDGDDDCDGLVAPMRARESNVTAVGTEDTQNGKVGPKKERMLLPWGKEDIETSSTLVRPGWGTLDVMPTAAIG